MSLRAGYEASRSWMEFEFAASRRERKRAFRYRFWRDECRHHLTPGPSKGDEMKRSADER